MAGLDLDPWQELCLMHTLGERADGTWAAFEVGLEVPRQNGKGTIEEARELTSLFLLEDQLSIHSAHQFDTSLEAFRRLLFLIESTPEFDRQVHRVSRSHGEEGVELKGGRRIRFRTRTKGGGKGFSCDGVLVLDEAMFLPEFTHAALLPTLAAQPNPQVIYAGSAVDQDIHDHGVVFTRIRERAVKGGDQRLAFFGWGLPYDHPDEVPEEVAADPEAWAQANPGMGIRITAEYIEAERRSLSTRNFAVERLGVGDRPATGQDAQGKISREAWKACADDGSVLRDPVCFAFDVTQDRSRSCISAAGARKDECLHGETVEHKAGTSWVADRFGTLVESHETVGVVCDGSGPAASLVKDVEEATGLTVRLLTAREYAQACGRLADQVTDGTFRHLDTAELSSAVRGAATRNLGEAWAWARKSSTVDISPLVGVTLALWGSQNLKPKRSNKAVF